MASSWNLFRIGRQRGTEDQLTEMLVWLSDAVPEVGKTLVQLAFGDVRDAEELELTTQHGIVGGRLDALPTSRDLALIVESKLGSTYGEGQIRRYLEWIEADFKSRPRLGLMTLTASEAPLLPDDVSYARAHGILVAARRWANLHSLLEPLVDEGASDQLASRLVREFLEMLSEEGLIPMQPLTTAETGATWADSWRIVRRYREFFHACKERIGEELGASPVSNSWSDRGDWFWQDYMFEDGVRVIVGLFCTDEFERIPAVAKTRSPLIWMAVQANHVEDWPHLKVALEANPPAGWSTGKRWHERPNFWRPLAPLLTAESFEEQREQLASAVAAARPWIDAAFASESRNAAES